jgi:hypothetical protein
MRRTSVSFGLPLLFLLSLVASACSSDSGGGPEKGNAFLRIVGSPQVEIGDGMPRELTVRYEDGEGQPLAGEIAFAFEGNPYGSQLTVSTALTDANGHAKVRLLPGQNIQGDVAFGVKATAMYATDARWNVSVYDPIRTYKLAGTYDMDSQFDLVEGAPGTIGDVVREIEAMTTIDENNGRYGLASWLLDKVLETNLVGDGVKSVIMGLRPGIDAAVKNIIDSYSPGWLNGLLETAARIDAYARHFQTTSIMVIEKQGETYVASHNLTGFVFDNDAEVTLASLGWEQQLATGLVVTTQGRTVTIAEHTFNIAYGEVLLYAINRFLVPQLADLMNVDGARDLNDLVQGLVDCESIGEWIFGRSGTVGASVAEAACRSGVRYLVETIEDKIRGVVPGTASGITITGTGTARVGHDGETVERLNGTWAGSLTVANQVGTLPPPNQTFIGTPRPVEQ